MDGVALCHYEYVLIMPCLSCDPGNQSNDKVAMCFWLLTLVALPETYRPRILEDRAKALRHSTHNWALHAECEEREISTAIIMEKYLTRPLRMLALEPILLFLAL